METALRWLVRAEQARVVTSREAESFAAAQIDRCNADVPVEFSFVCETVSPDDTIEKTLTGATTSCSGSGG